MKERRDLHRLLSSAADVNRLPLGHDWLRANDPAAHLPTKELGQSAVAVSRIRSLLVPLDGSQEAEHALPHALAIARRTGATVRLVHVHSLLDSVKLWQQYYSDKVIEQLKRKKQAYLQSVLHRVSRLVDGQVVAVLLESGDVVESLCDSAASAALIVMATKGRGPVGRLLHGSMAERLMRRLSCPLLIVRGTRSAVDLNYDPMPRHILVPLDGSNFAEQVFDSAAALGSLSGATITLAHIQDREQLFGRSALVDARSYLWETARRLEERVPGVNAEVVTGDQRIANSILTCAEELKVDWIALTSHGRRGLARLVRRSVANSVVRKATMHVLVFRPSVRELELQNRRLVRSC